MDTTRQGNRTWVDEAAADKLLANKLPSNVRWQRKLISPSQAEKLISKDDRNPIFDSRWEKLIHRAAPSGKTMVPDSDPRCSLAVQPELELNDLTAETDDAGMDLL